jgi:hypothetical protein
MTWLTWLYVALALLSAAMWLAASLVRIPKTAWFIPGLGGGRAEFDPILKCAMDDRPNGSVVSLPTPRPRFGEVMPLLRARRERPGDCRAAEQRDELAPLNSFKDCLLAIVERSSWMLPRARAASSRRGRNGPDALSRVGRRHEAARLVSSSCRGG